MNSHPSKNCPTKSFCSMIVKDPVSPPASMTMTSWSDLPPELIVTISESLALISDYIHFRSVCSAWRSATPASPRHLHLQAPRLFIPSPPPSSHYNLLSLPTSTTHPLSLPKSNQFLGSSDGLLLLRHHPSASVSLINPLTRSQTHLPSLKTFPDSSFFLKKIVISPPPLSVAIALLAPSTRLALCRPGLDSSWTLINGSSTYHDALFFNGRFHIADGFRRIFSLDDGNETLTEVARVRIPRMPPFIGRGEKCYLVESGGDLLLVVRLFKSVSMEGQRDAVVTNGFEVFRMEMGYFDGKSNYVEVKNLGNVVMFLGLNRSIALEGDKYPGFRRNCIYFLDDTLNYMGDVAQKVGDAGVFAMSDGNVEPLRDCIGDSGLVHDRQPAIWFTPGLC